RVFVKPMILWLWIGGGLMAVGTLLAAFPGTRRRRAIDPVSAPIATSTGDAGEPDSLRGSLVDGEIPDRHGGRSGAGDDEPEPEPISAGAP
ncbi:MAG: heme lyase CcmF/NrfE family subunit, partial [Actinomycetota bacterium]